MRMNGQNIIIQKLNKVSEGFGHICKKIIHWNRKNKDEPRMEIANGIPDNVSVRN